MIMIRLQRFIRTLFLNVPPFAIVSYILWSALLGYMSIEIRGLDCKVLWKIVAMYFSKQ